MLVSACLPGERVRYDGRAAPWEPPEIWHRWRAEGRLLPFCAECAAGFPVPRPSAERVGERVLEQTGADVTAAFRRGAELYTGLNLIPPIREKRPDGFHAVQTRIFSSSLCSEK